MQKEIQLYEVDSVNSNILIDIEFVNRIFIEVPTKTNKPLTSLSLRLVIILMQHLSMIEFRRLPQRKLLAQNLGVSQQSINSSLAELENVGFIIRRASELESVICVDEEDEKRIKAEFEEKKEIERKARRFSDEFIINRNYNISQEDTQRELKKTIESILSSNAQVSLDILELIKKFNK